MHIRGIARLVAAAGIVCSCGAGAAHADQFGFSYTAPTAAIPTNDAGGTFHSIASTYDTSTRRLSWTINFSDRVTQGYWMVINNGPNPKEHPGELGIFYFDASDEFDASGATSGVKLTSYGYNGVNGPNSWQDGNPAAAGNQAGDLIKGANNTGWIESISAANTVLPGGVNGRTLSFTANVGDIVDHSPLYPDAVDPWYGTGFGDQLGLWLHPVRTFDASYDAQGRITGAQFGHQGWLDASYLQVDRVPAPGAAAMAAAASLLLARRRRRTM